MNPADSQPDPQPDPSAAQPSADQPDAIPVLGYEPGTPPVIGYDRRVISPHFQRLANWRFTLNLAIFIHLLSAAFIVFPMLGSFSMAGPAVGGEPILSFFAYLCMAAAIAMVIHIFVICLLLKDPVGAVVLTLFGFVPLAHLAIAAMVSGMARVRLRAAGWEPARLGRSCLPISEMPTGSTVPSNTDDAHDSPSEQ